MSLTKTITMLATAFILTAIDPAVAQDWKQTFSSYFVSWGSVVSSADGSKVLAVGNTGSTSAIYTSADSGSTWVSNSAPFAHSTYIASSADLTKLVAVESGGGIWTSTNSGVAWTRIASMPIQSWSSVASSTDGVMLVAAAASDQISTNGGPVRGNGSVYTSTDSGLTWRSNTVPCNCLLNPAWSCVASSADGARLVVAGRQAGLYQSTNAGAIWTQVTAPLSYAVAVASSANGTKMVATGFDNTSNNIWVTSTNSGQTWGTVIAPWGTWNSVASSADGAKLVVVDYGNPIYNSTDSGVTWRSNSAPREAWLAAASSADGSKLVALARYGKIYTWQYQPTLALAASKTAAVISWPSSPFAVGFVPQQNTNLSAATWTDASFPIVDDGTNQSVTLGPPTNTLFFRLKKTAP